MKKNILLTLIALFCAVYAQAIFYGVKIGDLYYDLSSSSYSGNTATVTSPSSSSEKYSGDIIIPSSVTYEGTTYNVTYIKSYAFRNCTGLISINIPNSITGVGGNVFYGCTGLVTISIPGSIETIPEDAFAYCTNLVSVNIGDGIKIIEGRHTIDSNYPYKEYYSGAFRGCTKLKSINFPNSVTEIGVLAFEDCISLTSVTIPNSVTTLGECAFKGCSGITTLSIGNGITQIEDGTFYGCTGLTSVTIPSSVEEIKGSYYYKINDNLYRFGAFEGCTGLTTLHLGNKLIKIGRNAFAGCIGLTSLTIPNSVTIIDYAAFDGCSGLTSINLPNSITEIGDYAFIGCIGLPSITIPNSVTKIGRGAFQACNRLSSITIPNSVTSLGDGAFSSCTNLTSVTIGNGVTVLESGVYNSGTFGRCTSLTSIVIPDNVKNINNGAFQGCINLKSVTLPSNLTYISDDLFNGCTNLPSVTIPNGVTEIGESAFRDCVSLTSIAIPNNVTEIGSSAFQSCTNIHSMVLPDGVLTIGRDAFKGCKNLNSIILPEKLTGIEEGTFKECTGLTSITIPNSVTKINEGSSSYGYRNGAFEGCTQLSSIIIGSSMTQIGDYTFDKCTNLTKVDYKGDIKSWLDITFGSYYANPISFSHNLYINGELLTNLDIPQGVTTISDAFKGDTCIASITMPNSVTKIEASAFDGCKGITSVSIGSNVTSIGSYAFDDCDKLAMITIPNNVTKIGGGALRKCKNVVMLGTIPPTISNSTFSSDAVIRVPCGAVDSYLSASSWSSYSDQINGLSYNVILSATEGGFAKITSSDCSSNMVTIEATPASAYKFVRWSDGNTDNPRTMMVTSDINLTAEFTIQTYTISVTCDPQQGIVTGGGEYTYNANITIEAIPNAGYEFMYWDDYISSNPRSVMVYEDHTYRAIFKEIDHTITVTCDPQQGSVFGGGTYTHGATVTLAAIANKGYEFAQWSNGVTDNPYLLTATEDLTIEAQFVPATAVDNVSADGDTDVRKVFRDGQVYILRNGKTYTTTGVEVK